MITHYALVAAFILGAGVAHADPADDGSEATISAPADAPAADGAGVQTGTVVAPLPAFRPAAPAFGSRHGAAAQAPSAAPAPAAATGSTPSAPPPPSSAGGTTPLPAATPKPAASPKLGGAIGSAWTPEGTGIATLDTEYNDNRAAQQAVFGACNQKYQDAAKNAKPRASTGQPTAAQSQAAYAAVKAAGVDYVGAGYINQILACGGTAADAASVFSDACRHFQYPGQTLSNGCYFAFAKSHDGGQGWATAFCDGMPIFYECMQPAAGMQASYDPAEVLRRASFGASWVGNFTAQPTYDGQPQLDGHKMLTDRLAYFDRIKGSLADQSLDPQLIYTQIMTHELWEKCETGDYFCTSFNNMPAMSSYSGVTLTQWLAKEKLLNR